MGGLEYRQGMHQLGRGAWAYLGPPGTWGWSNCGLLVSGADALLVDTQFDLPLTRELLTAVAGVAPGVEIHTVVTTHANGDHCWGNQLLPRAEVVGSSACSHDMAEEVQPADLAALSGSPSPDTPLGDYMRRHFGVFDFEGICVTPPTRTFSGRLDLTRGDRPVELIEVGPAHTDGDVIVHVPDAGVVFAGDILFIGEHPIMRTGPVQNWIAACDQIAATGAKHVVPGHGPITDQAGVSVFRGYLEWVADWAQKALGQAAVLGSRRPGEGARGVCQLGQPGTVGDHYGCRVAGAGRRAARTDGCSREGRRCRTEVVIPASSPLRGRSVRASLAGSPARASGRTRSARWAAADRAEAGAGSGGRRPGAGR